MRRVTCDDVETSTRRDGSTVRRWYDATRHDATCCGAGPCVDVLCCAVRRGSRVLLNGAGRAGVTDAAAAAINHHHRAQVTGR